MNVQVKELEANVLATAPDKKKQKLLEENVSTFKTGMCMDSDFFFLLKIVKNRFLVLEMFKITACRLKIASTCIMYVSPLCFRVSIISFSKGYKVSAIKVKFSTIFDR